MDAVSSSYHTPLVILSIVIAVIASYAALDLAIQVIKAKSNARHIKNYIQISENRLTKQ